MPDDDDIITLASAIESEDSNGQHRESIFAIEKSRIQGTLSIVKFRGVDDRNTAELLRDAEVFVDATDLEELPDDTYYVKDLEGLRVIDDDTGEEIGEIAEVIQNTAQDIYRIVLDAEPDILVPAVKEFIRDVDIDAGTMRIHFIEGMR